MAFVFKLLFFVYIFIQNFDPGASITVPFTSLSPKLPKTVTTSSTSLDKNAETGKNCANPSTWTAVNTDFNQGTKSSVDFNAGSKSSIDFNLGSKYPSSTTSNSISAPCSVGNFQDGKIASPVTQPLTPTKQSVTVTPQNVFSQSSFVSNPQGTTSQISSSTKNSSNNLSSNTPTVTNSISPSITAGVSQSASNILRLCPSSSPQVELSLTSQKTCQNPQIQQQSLNTNNYLSQLQSFESQQQNSAQKQITSQSPITSSYPSQNSLVTSTLCDNLPSFSVTSASANLSEFRNEKSPDINLKSYSYIPNLVSGISRDIPQTQCNNKVNTSNLSIDIVNPNNNNGLTQNLQQNNINKYLDLLNFNTVNNVKGSQDKVSANSVFTQQNEDTKIRILQNQQPNLVNNVSNSGQIVLNSLNSNTACQPQEANIQENSQRIQSILQNANRNFNSISSSNNIPTISSSLPYSETIELNQDTPSFNCYAFAPNAQNLIAQPQLSSLYTISQDSNNIQSPCFKGFNFLSPSINLPIQSSDNSLQNANLQFASQIISENSNNNYNNASPFNIIYCNDSNVLTETVYNALPVNQNKQIVGQALPNCFATSNTQSFSNYENYNNIEPNQFILSNNQQTPFNIITSTQNSYKKPNLSNVAFINSKPCDVPSNQLTDNNPSNLGNVISIPQLCLNKNNQQIILNTQMSPNCPNNIQFADFQNLPSLSNAQDISQAQFKVENIGQSQNNPILIPQSNDCNIYNKDFSIITTSGAINNDNINYNLNDYPSISLTRIPNLANDNFQSISPKQPNLSSNFYQPTTLNSASQPELKAISECFAPVNSFNNNPRVLTLSPNFTFFGNLDNTQSPQSSNDISCVGSQNTAKESIPSRSVTLTVSPNFSYFSNIAPTTSNTGVNLDSCSNIVPYLQDQTVDNVEISISKYNQVIQPTITQISTPSSQYQAFQPTISQISSPVITNDSPKYQNAILDGMSSLLDHYRSTNQAIQTYNTPSEIPVEVITEPKCSTQPIQAIEIPNNSLASINQNDVNITPCNEIASFNQFSNTPFDFSSLFPYYTGAAAPVIEVATTNPSAFYSSSQSYPSSSLDSINPVISYPDANSPNFLPVLPPPPPLLIDSSRKSRPYDSVLKLLVLTELLDNDGCNNFNCLLPLLAAYNI